MISKGRVISRVLFVVGAIISLVLLAMFWGRMDTTQASVSKFDESAPYELQKAFEEAAQEFHVPLEILMSMSYNETRWNHHNGEPSTSGGYGIMHLTQVDQALTSDAKGDGISETKKGVEVKSNLDTLNEAAKLLDLDPEILKANPVENIRGGAALLAQYAEETMGKIPTKIEDWYGAVAIYNGLNSEMLATDFADRVYTTIQAGVERTVSSQHVILDSKNVQPNKKSAGT